VAPLGTTCRTPWGQACPHQGRAAARSTHSAASPAGCEFAGQRAAGTLGSSSAAPGRRYASGLGATVVTLPRGPPLSWLHPRAQHDPATTARRFSPASLALASRPFGRCSIGRRSLRAEHPGRPNGLATAIEFASGIDPACLSCSERQDREWPSSATAARRRRRAEPSGFARPCWRPFGRPRNGHRSSRTPSI